MNAPETNPETNPEETKPIRASDTLRGERNSTWLTMATLALAAIGMLLAVMR